MVQTELKKLLQYLLQEVESENIVSIDELVAVAANEIETHIFALENM